MAHMYLMLILVKAILANKETGVLDYRDLKVNKGITNIDITNEQLPTIKG